MLIITIENSVLIDYLNKKKSIWESNKLLGLICIETNIYSAILHKTPNQNAIREYAKEVKK